MGRVQIFVVHVERDAPAFRASARRVDAEVAGHFDQPHALLDFLLGPPAPPPTRLAEGDPDDPDLSP